MRVAASACDRDTVYSVAFSHNSKRLASAAGDCTIKVWDTSSGKCVRTLEGHSGTVYYVAFLHDSKLLRSLSSDRIIKFWDANSGECLETLKISKTLCAFTFDAANSLIRTELDSLAIRVSLASNTTNVTKPQYVDEQCGSVSSDRS
jgi:WD40 repeat protein